jgi:ditrans,polycis-polyprenyl diphosphate synthase
MAVWVNPGGTDRHSRAILNVCFNYTSRQEITAAMRATVRDYTKPIPRTKRNFSETHIARNIRAKNINSNTEEEDSNPSGNQEGETASTTGSTTLNTTASPPTTGPAAVSTGFPDPERITEEDISKHLYSADSPPVDLLIRTSGVERLSDFLLWQCHENTKIVFLDCMWPELDLWHFLPVYLEWQWQQRKAKEGRNSLIRRKPTAKTA